MSKKGKCSVQNWQSDPMNSPKAFGELIIGFFSTELFYPHDQDSTTMCEETMRVSARFCIFILCTNFCETAHSQKNVTNEIVYVPTQRLL